MFFFYLFIWPPPRDPSIARLFFYKKLGFLSWESQIWQKLRNLLRNLRLWVKIFTLKEKSKKQIQSRNARKEAQNRTFCNKNKIFDNFLPAAHIKLVILCNYSFKLGAKLNTEIQGYIHLFLCIFIVTPNNRDSENNRINGPRAREGAIWPPLRKKSFQRVNGARCAPEKN